MARLQCGDVCLEVWADALVTDTPTSAGRRPVECSVGTPAPPRWLSDGTSLFCTLALAAWRPGAGRVALNDSLDLVFVRAPERSTGWRATYAWHSVVPRVPQTPVLAARDDGRIEVLVPFGDEARCGFRGHLRFVLKA